jgi:hypothetical protein
MADGPVGPIPPVPGSSPSTSPNTARSETPPPDVSAQVEVAAKPHELATALLKLLSGSAPSETSGNSLP